MNMKHVCRHLIALVVILFIGQSYSYAAESFLNGNIIQQLQFAKENQIQFKIHPLIQQTEKHLQDYTQTLAQTAAVRMSSVSTPLVHVNDQGDIHVYIYVSEVSEALLTALAESNVHIEIVNEEFNIIQAWVPNDALINIQALPNVTKIDPPSYGVTNAGSVTTEGDAILRADEVRTQGVTGEGARVGVISDGVTSLSTSQSTGDLPANVTVLRSAAGDEGTAMLEIVHDLAPDATLGFCGIQSSLEFINCVNRLRTEFGADIIVDDIGFPSDPTFEDGMIAQTVSNGISNGVLHISAAGNGQQFHHEAEHVSNLTAFPGFDFHDFGIAAGTASDYSMDIILGPSATLTSFLHWNDPYGASSNDYHLGLLDETETTVLAVSAMIQDGNDDPIEAFSYTNPFPFSIIVKLAVERVSGAAGRRLEIQFLQELFQVQEHNIAAGGISGHQAVLNNLTVATINQNEPGNDEIASYSSFGPSRIDFPTLQIRPKPDITGIDCVSITGAGGFSNPFCGTSAAAPHIAGIAALLKSARPTATNTQIRNAITQSAVDLGSAGFDTIYGAGRADAAAAKQNLEVVIPPLSLPEISSPPDGSTFTSATQTFMWDAMGTPVTEWWINLGSTLGGRDIHVSGSLGTATSTTISNLPVDGSTVYARLWYRNGSAAWQSNDFSYTAFTGPAPSLPVITSPTDGSTFTSNTQTFMWDAMGTPVTEWWINLGSTLGGRDIHISGSLGTATSTTISNLPVDGSTVYARLWYRNGSAAWQSNDFSYTAFTGAAPSLPVITSPTDGSTFTSNTQTFMWDAMGTPVTEWWINLGSTLGGRDIHVSGSLGSATSTTISNLPVDGSTVYARLWYRNGSAAWQSNDFSYTAATLFIGQFNVSGAQTDTGCSDAADNGTYSYTGELNVTNQINNTYMGIITILTVDGIPLSGTGVSATGSFNADNIQQTSASGNYVLNANQGATLIARNEGMFTGTLNGNIISINYTGMDTFGDTCQSTGSFSGSR